MFVPTGRFYGSNVYFRIPVTFIFCYYNLLGEKINCLSLYKKTESLGQSKPRPLFSGPVVR